MHIWLFQHLGVWKWPSTLSPTGTTYTAKHRHPTSLPSLVPNFICYMHSLCSLTSYYFPRRKQMPLTNWEIIHKDQDAREKPMVFWGLPTTTAKGRLRSVCEGCRLETGRVSKLLPSSRGLHGGSRSQPYLAVCRLSGFLRAPQGRVQPALIQLWTLHCGFTFPLSFLLFLHWGWSLLLATRRNSELKWLGSF